MRLLEVRIESLMMPWIDKAEKDLKVARLSVSDPDLREVVGFHCQQAAEKYLKAFLTHVQVEFRKTHDLEELLRLAAIGGLSAPVGPEDAKWLTGFGVDVRYPGDFPEMLPGEELRALDIATRVKDAVLAVVNP
jgi:HEPN domain-containing protein